ncbi:ParA family protein [Peribacillus simplex]|uniref:ParA family protein n=1 Tax=Peribacillus simplex TaxID=1478 RepID=UPI003D2AB71A
MSKSGKVISFLNMKGGVGKTTLCKELADFLANHEDYDILVIDIDPQSNCTHALFEKFPDLAFDTDESGNQKIKENLPSIQALFGNNVVKNNEEQVILKLTKNLHLIPGDLGTVFMERNGTSTNEQKILHIIHEWDLKGKYDFIFIDCPPTYSFYTVSSLLASDYYLVPSKPDLYSVLGLDLLKNVVAKLVEVDQPFLMKDRTIDCLGIVLMMTGSTTGMQKRIGEIRDFASENNIHVFENSSPYYNKLLTGELKTFIMDRQDDALYKFLVSTANELVERIELLNGTQNNL